MSRARGASPGIAIVPVGARSAVQLELDFTVASGAS